MTTYRRFTTTIVNDVFVITEIPGTESHPVNWMATKVGDTWVIPNSREAAWDAARQQSLPVEVITLDGTRTALGVVFSANNFERRVYSGYVGYGLSMTDGYYAPIQFDAWVKSLRKNPDSWSVGGNDSRHTIADMDAYKAAMATV